MHIATIIAASFTAACTGIAYFHYTSTMNPNRHIPLFCPRFPNVPLWVDLVCCPAWWASGTVLCLAMPLWPGLALYCAAALPPMEIMRRRHNRRVGRPVSAISGARDPGSGTSRSAG
ncbi:hypothetical protein [Streptomyces avidinii]|uniref:Uncharacterized protein n=1 Tax=Streptomyces avidinii TaxID=1895 RepID=A0ABS4KWX5_STRAV|nr:hypothetical protein [Streptomyces avidinii]MBP2034525.1 hypothetical protein [Streptomyces avidinii]GGY86894.1 hypothetical protein GCM10010343_09920 [Streptomyces avidinii]